MAVGKTWEEKEGYWLGKKKNVGAVKKLRPEEGLPFVQQEKRKFAKKGVKKNLYRAKNKSRQNKIITHLKEGGTFIQIIDRDCRLAR